jgi:hypothetical protein
MANIAKRPDGKWRARYRDEAGKEHTRHFGKTKHGHPRHPLYVHGEPPMVGWCR